jgi:hypothetical protein
MQVTRRRGFNTAVMGQREWDHFQARTSSMLKARIRSWDDLVSIEYSAGQCSKSGHIPGPRVYRSKQVLKPEDHRAMSVQGEEGWVIYQSPPPPP